MREESQSLLEGAPGFVHRAVELLHEVIVIKFGGADYVKTIYVGFEIDGQMVAAAYPALDGVEVALALLEDHPSPHLVDATHLTWRTMPVACKVRSAADIGPLGELAEAAAERVKNGAHHVDRTPEFFQAVRSTRGRPYNRSTGRRE